MSRVLTIAVFLSGEGTTFDALAESIAGGHLPARIVLVLADRPHAAGIERARHRGLPTAVRPLHGPRAAVWSTEVDQMLRERQAELVVLAGFLGILPPPFVAKWAGRIINVHPSLLPKFGGPGMFGLHVHEAVLAAGEVETGATVHLVTDDLDRGPRLLQEAIPVTVGESAVALRDRLRPIERELLREAIRRFADGEWPLPYPTERAAPASEKPGRTPG